MCGIAGYNVSKDVYSALLDGNIEKQKEILRKAWLHNLHRGYDASGYMGLAPEGNRTFVYKNGDNAVELLMDQVDKDDFNITPMQVFGAHTRAGTLGSAKINHNNHPVSFEGIYVTHNGHISNHTQLRTKYIPFNDRSQAPQVDSYLIPVVLDEFANSPLDDRGIMAALRELDGAFAFHAMWTSYPGVSVIARGNGRPLVIAYNDGEGFFYGSEPESVWSIMNTMGVDPNHSRWNWDALDSDKFLVIDAGSLAKWGGFKKPVASAGPVKTTRYLPKEKGVNKQAHKVYETSSQYDFLNKHPLRSIKGNESQATLRYDRRRGFINKAQDDEGFPFEKEASVGVSISEADKVYWFADHWHVFFNNVEVVMNDNRVIKDVYNHNLFDNEQRFATKKNPLYNANYVPGADLSADDFLRFHLTPIKTQDVPIEESEYAYVLMMAKEDKKSGKVKSQPSQGTQIKPGENLQLPKKSGGAKEELASDSIYEAEGIEDDENTSSYVNLVDPPTELTWDNFFAATFSHETEDFHFVGSDRKCPQHDQYLRTHTDPESCESVLLAATYAMAATTNIDILSIMDREFVVHYDFTEDACYDRETKQDKCKWTPNQFIKVTAAHSAWLITVGELCAECGSLREISELPSWFSLLDISDAMMVIPGGKRSAS